ncbi:MAG TPA: Maf family protein [Solirubrobacteraceae bacterium]|nr:Maf family protein [Solirubrobacteraceae bacterium]
MALILASASPQRAAILSQIGVSFEVRSAGVQELAQGPPAEVVLENAHRKAVAVASKLACGSPPVLGADTEVVLDGSILGKPADARDAALMLERLAGRRHVVLSGICLAEPVAPGQRPRTRTAASRTVVELRPLERRAIDAYVATGEWRGRAGAYAVQGIGATLVTRIEGDYLGVVGLPVATLIELAPWLAP